MGRATFLSKLFGALMLVIALALSLAGCGSSGVQAQSPVKHVWVITLENESYSTTFGANTPATYLAKTLASQGALVPNYYGTGHVSLDNYVSMISGQAGTPQTIFDCQTYQDFTSTGVGDNGQVLGSGCVYPAAVKTLPDQLKAAGYSWKSYNEDMGNDPNRESATCGHPTLNTADQTQIAEAPSASVPLGDQYATRHNPFVYFHSIIDSPDCATHVVNLNSLMSDLQSVSTTANFNFITPNLCNDGHDSPCVNGQPGGLTSANTFLQKWIPLIMASPAYQQDGLIIINFDEGGANAPSVAPPVLTSTYTGASCCFEVAGPNLPAFPYTVSAPYSIPAYGVTTLNLIYKSFGGDQTGAVMLSPFIKPGTVSNVSYNHYSLLRSLEGIFNVSYLGYAGTNGLVAFGTDIFTNLPSGFGALP